MAQPTGSIQVQVPSWIARGSRYSNSLDWLVSQYGGRSSDRLDTIQMRSICDSQAVPQACKATLKHQVSGLSWYLAKDEEGNEPLKETDAKGKHYYDLLRGWMDDEGHTIGFASGVDLLTDDVLVARQGGCNEVIRDKSGVAQYVLHVDAATIRFTHDSDHPVYQVSPWGEVTEAWEADRFMQVRWHPNPKIGAALSSRSPVQLAYSAIAILAGTDTYNWKLIAEPIPAGILNLGPGFKKETAAAWKASWDASMQGINPEPLAIVYGTPNLDYKAFRPPPRDMAFETTDHWYASLVAACFEMSILDISILTKVSTKAAAEEQAEATKRQGLRQLMRKVREAIEEYLLEEGIFFIWEDIDKTDEKVMAEIASKDTARVVQMVGSKLLTEEQGLDMLKQLRHVPDDVKYDEATFEERRQEMTEQMKPKEEKGGEKEEQAEEGEEEQETEKEKGKAKKSVEKAQDLEKLVKQAEDNAQRWEGIEKGQRNIAKEIRTSEEAIKVSGEEQAGKIEAFVKTQSEITRGMIKEWLQNVLDFFTKTLESVREGILKHMGIIGVEIGELKEQQILDHATIEKTQEKTGEIQQNLRLFSEEVGSDLKVVMSLVSKKHLGAQKLLRLEKAIDLAKDNYRDGKITAEEIAEYLLAELLEADDG